jgi:hypothetical protein
MKKSFLFAGLATVFALACQPSGESVDSRSFAYFGDTIETQGA